MATRIRVASYHAAAVLQVAVHAVHAVLHTYRRALSRAGLVLVRVLASLGGLGGQRQRDGAGMGGEHTAYVVCALCVCMP